ncbi:hypothetical protein QQP08_005618, partial [Theobroma cacao]
MRHNALSASQKTIPNDLPVALGIRGLYERKLKKLNPATQNITYDCPRVRFSYGKGIPGIFWNLNCKIKCALNSSFVVFGCIKNLIQLCSSVIIFVVVLLTKPDISITKIGWRSMGRL